MQRSATPRPRSAARRPSRNEPEPRGSGARGPGARTPAPKQLEGEAAYRAAVAFLVSTQALVAGLPASRRALGRRLRRRAIALVVRVAKGVRASPPPLESWMPAARRSSRECVAMLETLALACPSRTDELERGRSRLAEVVARLFLLRLLP